MENLLGSSIYDFSRLPVDGFPQCVDMLEALPNESSDLVWQASVRLYYKRFCRQSEPVWQGSELQPQGVYMPEPIRNSPPTTSGFAAFVGIDWGDKEHAWMLQETETSKPQKGKLKQSPEAIDEWALSLAQRFPGGQIAVALEQSRGALVCALSKYGHLTLFPVHPGTSSQYRSAWSPSGAKDDPKDAALLLDLLLRHRDRLRPLRPDTEQTRQLQVLVEQRRQLVDEKTAQTNRITARLKFYFPQILTWFGDLDSPLVRSFLKRWPTLSKLQAEDPQAILTFLHAHNCRSAERNQQRLKEIAEARPLTTDPAVVQPAVMMVATLLDVVAVLRDGIAELEQAIQKLCAAHPDYSLFESLPGAGPALAPRLLAALGTQRDRFAHVRELQAYSGIAPVISSSGQSVWIHFRWACPKFLRQSFHEFAGASIQQSAWARAYYDRQRAKGKSHQATLRALAFKWIRIIFRCWKDRTLYSETLRFTAGANHQARAKAENVPAPPVKNPADGLFKKSSGFWKFSGVTA